MLEKACENDETLEMVVGMRPALDLLGEVGVSLLIKCVMLPLHRLALADRSCQVLVDVGWRALPPRDRLYRARVARLVSGTSLPFARALIAR